MASNNWPMRTRPPLLSLSPRIRATGRAAIDVFPLSGLSWSPYPRLRVARFEAWSRSAPSPDTGHLSVSGPPVHSRQRVSGHYPAFNYYEPSDSSEGIGLPFPAGL